jgi:hypothetical protein
MLLRVVFRFSTAKLNIKPFRRLGCYDLPEHLFVTFGEYGPNLRIRHARRTLAP